jgi:DNA adenine methylase
MNSKKLYTPLRYPGGKAKFAPYVTDIIKTNDIYGGHYIEPFAGGAGVALDLLFSNTVSHIHINDIDPAIHLFWQTVVTKTDELLKLIVDTPVSMEQWYYWRSVMNGDTPASTVHKGFATLFMNRTNRSGILKAGVIGGKGQFGVYKLGDRFNKASIISRIERIAEYRERISIYAEDALSLLKRCDSFLPEASLVYLDPPYYVKGQGLYRNFYTHEDHLAIASLLQSIDFKYRWLVSYDNAPEICLMYKNRASRDYLLKYSAQKNYDGAEVMFFSDNLQKPHIFNT